MTVSESLKCLETACNEVSKERLEYFDFLGLLRGRLAVLLVQLSEMQDAFDANHFPVYVSYADYMSAANLLVCEELSKMLGDINNLLSGQECENDHDE